MPCSTETFQMIAICPDESMAPLRSELITLGATDIEDGFRALRFKISEAGFYRIHLYSRFASRFLLEIKNSSGSSKEIIVNQASKINWFDYFSKDMSFKIDGVQTNRGAEHLSSNAISKAIRLGIELRCEKLRIPKPRVELIDPDVRIVGWLRENRLILSIDTSGMAMHKRGYRKEMHPAPIKETLAATILQHAGYTGNEALHDPMCGGGTIAIEAAMIALNKAPLIHRKDGLFGFERLAFFNRALWREVSDAARHDKNDELAHPIFASDISGRYVSSAQVNALKARVERYIDFSVADFFKLKKKAPSGLLVCNLPYGERVDMVSDTNQDFYRDIGDHLKKEFSGWRIALLAADDGSYKHIGLKPSKKIRMANGSLPVVLLMFEIFAGKRRDFVVNKFLQTEASHSASE